MSCPINPGSATGRSDLCPEIARRPLRHPPTAMLVDVRRVRHHGTTSPDHIQLAMDNLGLIGWVIDKFGVRLDSGYGREDAWQDGWIGLLRAAEKFDPSKGFRFSTYATHHIRAAIQHGRGTFEGRGYRSEKRSGEEPTRVTSLDALVAVDMSDPSAADVESDVEACVISAIAVRHIQVNLDCECRDAVDRLLAERLGDPHCGLSIAEIERQVVEESGAPAHEVRKRSRSIRSRMRRYRRPLDD